MKYILLTIMISLFVSCSSNKTEIKKDPDLLDTELIKDGKSINGEANQDYGNLLFENPKWNFGKIQQNETVEHTFTFTNSGSRPVIISNAAGSCGCTVPTWPKEPINPGDSGEILVKFSSGTKKGKQSKAIIITANTKPNQTRLFVEGEIITP